MMHAEGTLRGMDGFLLYQQSWRPKGKAKAQLAIVHGIGEHSGRYGNLVGFFVPKGYGVWAFDLRGHGRTEGPRGHIDSWEQVRGDVGAFLELVRESQPGIPVFLYGHSMGGLIGIEYALHHAEGLDGLIASAPGLDTSAISPLKVALAKMMSRLWPGLTLDTGLEAAGISRDPKVVDAYLNDPLVHFKASARFGAESIGAMAWVWEHAAGLTLPLLILQGEEDRLVSPASVIAFFESVMVGDKTLMRYPGGYHEPHNDLDKERVFADVAQWIEARL